MKIIIQTLILLTALMPFFSNAGLKALDETELANTTGQATIKIDNLPIDPTDMTGTRLDGSDKDLSFTRITLGANIDLNANIDEILVGIKDRTTEAETNDRILNPELPADVDLENLKLGRILADENGNPYIEDLNLRDPYLEFARDADENIVGVRLGFKQIDGHVGLSINAISGDIAATGFVGDFNVPVLEQIIDLVGARDPDTGLLELHPYSNGIRTNRLNDDLFDLITITVPTDLINQVTLKNSRNLYLGFQSQEVNYPKVGPGAQETALPGFWLNLQDGLKIEDLTVDYQIGPYPGNPGNVLDLRPTNPPINNSFQPYY